MKKLKGTVASEGVVIGEAFIIENVSHANTHDYENTYDTYTNAKDEVRDQLDKLYEKTLETVGKAEADIIDVQRLMLSDPDYDEEVKRRLDAGQANIVTAVKNTGEQFADTFRNMDNDYFKARATDVLDITSRIVDTIQGTFIDFASMPEKSVVIGEDITPSQTLSMEPSKIAAFVMSAGSMTGHTSILARTLDIPSIIQVGKDVFDIKAGDTVIVDGKEGAIAINPSDADKETYNKKFEAMWLEKENLEKVRGLESVTQTGKKINVFANIGSVADAEKAFEADAEGVGLFRSEFVYLGRDTAPSEDEQYKAYLGAAKAISKDGKLRTLVIRTLDIGADKNVSYLGLPSEENPALGYRALRISLDMDDIFKTQLKAIYRAAKECVENDKSSVAVMFPMVASVWEVEKAKEMISKVRAELAIPLDTKIEVGIMIETPAAAILADVLAKHVDFFSVGTNDLTQYTLAIDRQGTKEVEKYYDAHHPAILRELEMIAKAARENGIWSGICGELGGDLELTEFFINAGFTELSVSPPKVLPLREKIRSLR
jgi:phosphotransferase system enzyme I (PtsI)